MNSTKIEWADMTWNPVTGCRHACEYCYARRIAERFGGGGTELLLEAARLAEGSIELEEPVMRTQKSGKTAKASFPYGFIPTFHRYRLDEPLKMNKPQTIFVVSMGDLFGDWVPTSWIKAVFDACLAAPWHTYMFLTKNPQRYVILDKMALLPRGDNFWYGTTVTSADDNTDLDMMDLQDSGLHIFWSVEPMMGPISEVSLWVQHPDLIIVGAETGNRKGKVTPERKWVDELQLNCVSFRIPVLWKDNIRKLYPDLPASAPRPGR